MIIEDLFERKCTNGFDTTGRFGEVKHYSNPSMYLASINAYNEGKSAFYGCTINGKFVEQEPRYEYVLKKPLNEKEYLYLKKRCQ